MGDTAKMTHGELLTRIIAKTTFRVTPHGTEEVYNITDIKQLIDEAKADFPKIEIQYVGSFLITTTPYEKAVADWFEKWYGDNK